MTVLKNCEFSRCLGHDLPYYFERPLFASCLLILFSCYHCVESNIYLPALEDHYFEIQWGGVGEGRQNLSGLTLPVTEELN